MTELKVDDVQNKAVFDRIGQLVGRVASFEVDPQTKAVKAAVVKLDDKVKAKYPNLSKDTFPLDLAIASITKSKSIRLNASLDELKANIA